MAQGSGESWKTTLTWAFRSRRVATADGLRPATVVVKADRIVDVAEWNEVPVAAHLRDYGDHVLLPGLVDTHVHINEPGRTHWEGFRTATQAAAAGGVTTLVDMPLNCKPETISVAALEAKRAAVHENESGSVTGASEGVSHAWVDWMSWGGVVGNHGGGGNEAEIPWLIEAGVPGFKCFLVHSGIDGFAWVDEAQLRKALAMLRVSGLPLLVHAELAGPIDRATALINSSSSADWRSYATYLASRPDEAEIEAIELLIGLADVFDARLHIVHLATAKALPAIQQARAAGLKITVETCPQYLWFAAEEIPDGATEFKCAPPIRNADNREALWQALRDGVIDMVATDHSPCPPEMKNRDSGRFDQAWGGIASLGLALPVVWTGLRQRGGGLELLAKWMAEGPARLAGLTGRKGALAPGYDADFAVLDSEAEWTVTEEDLRFRHKLSPYLGASLRGKVLETYLRGECIYWGRSQDSVLDPKARGQEIRRTP
ncbi:allantoinase AllB [Acidicapsa acidisoli]|uniref:allantoinase AllB n=1 Tax=Acidicapsa acidisoli TaxID=1615681 RepID=UPI0021E0A244|nr:allantoinase AllB [Acidicapsa acidisoli]